MFVGHLATALAAKKVEPRVPPGTIIVEGGMFVAAIVLYQRFVRPVDRLGRWAFWGLVGLTGVSWLTGPWSPPPPSATAVALVALAMWILPFWAEWIERHRTVASAAL